MKVDTFSYENDMMNFKDKDDVLTALIHLGYVAFEEKTEEVSYLLTFVVDGKVAQSRYAPCGEALGPLPQIWVSDGAILSSWQCGEEPVSPETIATSDMVLIPQGQLYP